MLQCNVPGYAAFAAGDVDTVWDCSESEEEPLPGLDKGNSCVRGFNEMYSWVPGTDPLTYPEGVGLRVLSERDLGHDGEGKDKTAVLVLQVHYEHFDQQKSAAAAGGQQRQVSDGHEGMILHFVSAASHLVQHDSSAYRLASKGILKAGRVTKAETSCLLKENMTMHAMTYLVHAHTLVTHVSGWIVRTTEQGKQEWSLIAKDDPKVHPSRYPIMHRNITMRPGDVLAARCTFNNTLDRDVVLG